MPKIKKLGEWFSKQKLKQKVRILFIIILGIYFIFSALVYYFVIHRSTREYIVETNFNRLTSIGDTFHMELEGTNTVSKWIINSQEVRYFLRSGEDETSLLAKEALGPIHEFTIYENFLSSVYIFNNNKDFIHITNLVTNVDMDIIRSPRWYEEIVTRAGGYVLRVNGGGAFATAADRTLISFIRQINDVSTQMPIGILVMNYTSDILGRTFVNASDNNNNIAFFTDDGYFISGNEEFVTLYENLEWDDTGNAFDFQTVGNITIYRYQIPDTPFVVISFEGARFLEYISPQSIALLLVFIVVTILAVVIIGLFISNYIAKPIGRLSSSMELAKSGWLKRVSIKLADDEIGHLKDNYNEMLIELNRLMEELVEKEKVVQQASFEAMQEQIKPHFLYNTLETIGYLALEKPRDEVYEAVEVLGSFYRKFLSSGNSEITLGDELEIIKNYLQLQKVRYEDVFTDEYQIDETLLDIMVPRLILQPLVENSLYHGIRMKGEKGVVKISVYKSGDRACISIYDTGIGIKEEAIRGIDCNNGERGFGLRKTILRIRNYYDETDVYEINTKAGYYCEIILKIPMSSTGKSTEFSVE